MPRATIASRELKNKQTGIDLFVLSFNEIQGLMSSTVYYQVVLVSNLACFKTPSHKESDVVQYSIEKQWSEFEELRTKISELFSVTVLPLLNKKSIIVNDQVLRERRNSLDQFVKFIASVPKMAVCVPLLEFLGVDSMRAKGFSQGEAIDSSLKHSTSKEEEQSAVASEPQVNVFDESANDEPSNNIFDDNDRDDVDDEALFGTISDRVQVGMFEQQDMAGEITEEDEKILGFLPDAIITKSETIRVVLDEEDNSDLLTIEDDLDKLMTFDVAKKEKTLQQKEDKLLTSPKEKPTSPKEKSTSPTEKPTSSTEKPTSPTEKPTSSTEKPTSPADKSGTPMKPSPALKPKPPTKPKVVHRATSQEESETMIKTVSSNKPRPAPKPRSLPSEQDTIPDKSTDTKSSPSIILTKNSTESGNVDILGQDDIMTYLRENSTTTTDEVDLFS